MSDLVREAERRHPNHTYARGKFIEGGRYQAEESAKELEILQARIDAAIHGLSRMSTAGQKDLLIKILEGKRERF